MGLDLTEGLKTAFLSYSISVIVSRAMPDVRDGLKPVHRRILYSMFENSLLWNKRHAKSARIVGDVIGKYHPHGDTAVYEALVRMVQPFSLLEPLINGQGNFGSIDGDPPAAMRYTEAKLSNISKYLLSDLSLDTVDFRLNYDGLEKEPIVLPARFPNILVNGVTGVAVGMATNIPCHNIVEVLDACLYLVDNPEANIVDLMNFVKGPDFPTGGVILGVSGAISALKTGKGGIVICSKTHFEKKANRDFIIVTELPYQVNKARLIENIALLVRDKRIDGISDLRDESDKSGIRIVIEIKRSYEPNLVLNQLLNLTNLKIKYSVNMMVLDKNMRPSLMNLKQILSLFLDHRKEVVRRRSKFEMEKARDKAISLIALYVAMLNMDDVIRIIKDSDTKSEAQKILTTTAWVVDMELKVLIEKVTDVSIKDSVYFLTEIQADSILNMKLHALTKLEKNKVGTEINFLIDNILYYSSILSDYEKLKSVIKDEFSEIKAECGHPRRTVIDNNADEVIDDEDLIKREELVITFTSNGYIKSVSLTNYRTQKRGGKGKVGQSVKDEDFVKDVFVVNSHDEILFFSTKARVYKLKAYRLPHGDPTSKGRAIVNIFELQDGERINTVMPIPPNFHAMNFDIVFISAMGKFKRNKFEDYYYIPTNGKLALSLVENDFLVSVKLCHEDNDALIATRFGKSIRFAIGEARLFKGRVAEGIRGIKLADNDKVISMSILLAVGVDIETRDKYLKVPSKYRTGKLGEGFEVAKECIEKSEIDLAPNVFTELASKEQFILTVTENGYGKRTSAYEYRTTGRAGVGVANMNVTDKTGKLVDSFSVDETDNIIIMTNKGQLIMIPVKQIPILSRTTQGVILCKTKKEGRVVAVARALSDFVSEDSEIIEGEAE